MKRFAPRACALALFSILFAAAAFADSMSMPASSGTSPAQPRSYGEPPLRNAKTAAAVVASLEATSADDVAALRAYNAAGNVPARVGVVRTLVAPLTVTRGVRALANDEPFRWRGSARVAGGNRLRLQLTGVNVPADAKFWAYGAGGEAYGFDAALAYQGTLWTPSVEGDTITIEVETRGSTASFTISAVTDIRPVSEVIPHDASCIQDAGCYANNVISYGSAVALMQFVSGGSSYICTGSLIIDAAKTYAPYFLTANHCISTASEAASLEAIWDYRTTSCNGGASITGKPRSQGATLLATTTASDSTLLRLGNVPGSRYWLGWNANLPASGTTLYRVSHPYGEPLRYSTSTVTTVANACGGWPRPAFLYQYHLLGTTGGGSSGSPVLNSDGQILGQLAGSCGPDSDVCNIANRTVDGALSSSYSTLAPYINAAPPTCSTCTPNANTACMLNGRFKVTMTWRDPSANQSGNGRLINYAENKAITDPANGEVSQVTFWSMYANDPNSVEALVRIIRGGSSFWIFTTGFAAAEYTVTVQDTQKCNTWTRTSAFGATNKIADYNALPF